MEDELSIIREAFALQDRQDKFDHEHGLNLLNHAREQLVFLSQVLNGDIGGLVGPVALASTCALIVDSALHSLSGGIKEFDGGNDAACSYCGSERVEDSEQAKGVT